MHEHFNVLINHNSRKHASTQPFTIDISFWKEKKIPLPKDHMFKDLRKMKKNSFQSIASNAAKVSHPANLKNHSLDVARLHYTDIWVLY